MKKVIFGTLATLVVFSFTIKQAFSQSEKENSFLTPKAKKEIRLNGNPTENSNEKARRLESMPDTVQVYGEKFFNTYIVCDTVMGFTDVKVGDMPSFELKVGRYMKLFGETSLKNRIGEAYGQNPDGAVGVTYIFPYGIMGFQIQNIDTLDIKPIVVRTADNNPFLQDNVVAYGADVAVISVSGIATTDGLGTSFSRIFDESPQPLKLENPKLYVDSKTKDITITADNIRTNDGKPGYYLITYNGNASIEEDVNHTLKP